MVLRTPVRRIERMLAGEVTGNEWWAVGDAPVRVAEALAPLVDGRSAMLAMCVAFLTAKHTIWLADWSLHAQLLMVRGKDQRAGRDGSPEQHALIERLRAAGLDEDALALWSAGRLRVMDVLGFAAQRGVDVRVLLWDPFDPFGRVHIVNDPRKQQKLLESCGVHCRLDKNSRSPFHVAQALHQKCAVVDGYTAFVGGVDLTVEYGGDFDRWDTSTHPFASATRATDLGPAPHPWHDVHTVLAGNPAQDVERNIRQRWDETYRHGLRRSAPPLKTLAKELLAGERDGDRGLRDATEGGDHVPGSGAAEVGSAVRMQVVRTIPALTYRFAPQGIHGIAQAYILALRQARRFIYLESQYLWLETFSGLDIWRLGWPSHFMQTLLDELAGAAERGIVIGLVLPDHPNAGREYTDNTIAWLRRNAPGAARDGRLRFFTLATSDSRTRDNLMRYRPVYVHAKVGIVDDTWATVGSANLNSRGMSHDAELNISVLDDEFARSLRLALWAEHLGLFSTAHTGWPAPAALPLLAPLPRPRTEGVLSLLEEPVDALDSNADWLALRDPLAGLDILWRRAQDNLDRLCGGERLVGQLLPYLTRDEGHDRELTVDAKRGLLDPLRQTREGVHIRHVGKYV
ncbi:MAG TPA: phospholipase D-like domain-containing protein [Ktedonobacterales bacterium]|nr:phospholipase D-like domain-containing protein [Ktedonobacterales bacterium]